MTVWYSGERTNEDMTFGPVPSRRFGNSLGINNVPLKTCSYSCIYCQLGRTDRMTVDRKRFFSTDDIVSSVERSLASVDEIVDVITFVPDGEPTLDEGLGDHIDALKRFDMDIVVITNSSLLRMDEVKRDLSMADIVSVKVDSVVEDIWKKVDRPHGKLELDTIMEGLLEFSRTYKGSLQTETMLVEGVNDICSSIEITAEFIAKLNAERHHITVPIRPPAEGYVRVPGPEALASAFAIFSDKLDNVVLTTGKEKGSFGSTGDLKRDLLAIASVHPMREDSVTDLVKRSGGGWEEVEDLLKRGDLKQIDHGNTRFYVTSSEYLQRRDMV